MAILNSKFDILRGWPDGSAIAEDFTIVEVADKLNTFRSGHFVELGAHGAYTAGSDAATLKSDGRALGLVIEGQEDYSSRMSKTVTCLIAGGYVVKLHLEADQAGFQGSVEGGVNQFRVESSDVNANVAMAAGVQVVVWNGLVEPYKADFHNVANQGFVKPIGTCLRYDSADNTCDILVH